MLKTSDEKTKNERDDAIDYASSTTKKYNSSNVLEKEPVDGIVKDLSTIRKRINHIYEQAAISNTEEVDEKIHDNDIDHNNIYFPSSDNQNNPLIKIIQFYVDKILSFEDNNFKDTFNSASFIKKTASLTSLVMISTFLSGVFFNPSSIQDSSRVYASEETGSLSKGTDSQKDVGTLVDNEEVRFTDAPFEHPLEYTDDNEAVRNSNSTQVVDVQPTPQVPVATRANTSGNTYSAGYCTWYVKNRRPDLPNNLGNARTWFSRAASQGIPTGSTPRVGAVGQRGNHVVYVESVNTDGTVTISDMNWSGLYVKTVRTVAASSLRYIY